MGMGTTSQRNEKFFSRKKSRKESKREVSEVREIKRKGKKGRETHLTLASLNRE